MMRKKLAKLILVDVALSFGDLCTDLLQILILLSNAESRGYGFVSLLLIYYPAPLYLLCSGMNQINEPGWIRISRMFGKLVFHPFLLTLAYIKLIWKIYNNKDW
jgi:hypothetical protein